MKRVTASAARKNWFSLLDEVAAGEVVLIERGGRRILLKRDHEADAPKEVPDYRGLIDAPAVDHADRWRWRWEDEAGELALLEEPED